MANILGLLTVNHIKVLEVDGNPSTASGTSAPTGSVAIVTDGTIWQKIGSLDTDWVKIGDNGASIANESDLDTLTWTALVAPSGSVSKKYRWVKINDTVQFWAKITASVAGSEVNNVVFDLPGDMPQPMLFASQPNNAIIAVGHGGISTAAEPSSAVMVLYKDPSGAPKLKISLDAWLVSDAPTHAWGYVAYKT